MGRCNCLVISIVLCLILATILRSVPGKTVESSRNRQRRVIGGTQIEQGQWPFLVNLHGHVPSSQWWVFVTNYVDYSCGGALIAKRWVLTAAHCFSSINPLKTLSSPLKWHVKAGDIYRKPGSLLDVIKSALGGDVSGDSGRWWFVRASKIIIHPDYEPADTFSWKYDLALVKLAVDIPMAPDNPNIDPVTMPTNLSVTWPPPGTNCSLMGWGCTSKDGANEKIARQIYLPVLPNSDCSNEYGDLGDNRVCAGFFNEGKGVCKGDSGGPLVCLDGNTWKQAGIISYTSSSDPSNLPGVFTRVTKYLTWITNTTSTN